MIRARFALVGDPDWRPVTCPDDLLPYWCSGYDSADQPIVIAFAKSVEQVMELWPNAEQPIDFEEVDGVTFSDRFPKPHWYEEVAPDA